MVTKRISSGKTATRRKAPATAAPELTDSAVMAVLEPSSTSGSTSIDPDVRRQLVATEAYFLAERRGFAAGHEFEDWIAAEAAVDLRCHKMQVA
jgi:Protein of unknown function (DUF2934)